MNTFAFKRTACGWRNAAYCETLVDAGIDEYFISLTADTADLHDHITEVPGSFDRTMQGLHNLNQIDGVRLMTNTVVTRLSYQSLPGVVDLLSDLNQLVEMDFWNYWPMQEDADLNLLVSHFEVQPYLRRAVVRARELGRCVEVKNYPHCLLGTESDALCNDQPELRIDPRFWDEFNRNGFHQCEFPRRVRIETVSGLNTAYVKQFGWHEDQLRPHPRSA